MKKTIALFLVLLTTTTVLTSCFAVSLDSDDTQSLGTQSNDPSQTDDSSKTDDPSETGGGAPSSDSTKPTIQEQVLYDVDGVKITATGEIEENMFGTGIKLLVENNTDKDLGIGIDHLIVNNYMISDLFSETVPAGKKTNCTLDLMDLEKSGISKIGLVEVYMHTFDSETYMTVSDLGRAEIKTDLYDSMDGGAGTGTEILNQDGIKVTAQYIDNDSFWGKEVVLYIENNSDHDVTLNVDDLSVNDYAITSLGYFSVLTGKKMIASLNLFESELEDNGIETIEKVEFKLRAYDPNTFKDYFTSDVITCTPE